MANSSHVIGEPFGAMPLLQSRNRFVPLPHQVDQIQTYAQCVNMLDDAAYFAHGQAVARGNDPLRAQYASYFHNFAHGQMIHPHAYMQIEHPDGASPISSAYPSAITVYADGTVVRKSNSPATAGACSLLKTKSAKKYAWPAAKEQLRAAVTSFHSGKPLALPPATSVPAIQCATSYTDNGATASIAPWLCEM